MTYTQMNSFGKVLQTMMQNELYAIRNIEIMVVDSLPAEDKVTGLISKCLVNIRHPIMKVRYENVPVVGTGLGNLKGVIAHPEVGDLVLVGWLDTTSTPIVFGSIMDNFSQKPDSAPLIKRQELFLTNKQAGGIIYMMQDNSIVARAADAAGNLANGARLMIKPDGSFKLFNKDNFGIEVDSGGNMTLRGVTINHVQTPGSFP